MKFPTGGTARKPARVDLVRFQSRQSQSGWEKGSLLFYAPEGYLQAFLLGVVVMEERYMARALELAAKAKGRTSPNPLVGAVLVKEGQIVGEGFHEKAGGPHAEAVALERAREGAQGADLYVNLEPCSHYGRTPPCAERIIQAGVRRVYAAMVDPNPKVAGRGLAMLREAGIEVHVGCMEREARRLNEVFIKYITTGRPFILLKTAMSLDGKIATHTGDSRWISSAPSREMVHRLRDELDGIMVGSNTVLQDDPQLTTRLPQGGRDPVRIIIDSQGKIPPTAKVFRPGRVIWATTKAVPAPPHVEVITFPGPKIDLGRLSEELGRREITSVLLEGGGGLNDAALKAGIVDKVMFFIAPLLIGGQGPTPIGGQGVDRIKDAYRLTDMELTRVDDDILITGYLAGGGG